MPHLCVSVCWVSSFSSVFISFEYAFLHSLQSRSQKGLIPIIKEDTFNLNPMLLQNIMKSPYFIKCCTKLQDWNMLVDEIYYELKHLEPWSQGKWFLECCTVLFVWPSCRPHTVFVAFSIMFSGEFFHGVTLFFGWYSFFQGKLQEVYVECHNYIIPLK